MGKRLEECTFRKGAKSGNVTICLPFFPLSCSRVLIVVYLSRPDAGPDLRSERVRSQNKGFLQNWFSGRRGYLMSLPANRPPLL